MGRIGWLLLLAVGLVTGDAMAPGGARVSVGLGVAALSVGGVGAVAGRPAGGAVAGLAAAAAGAFRANHHPEISLSDLARRPLPARGVLVADVASTPVRRGDRVIVLVEARRWRTLAGDTPAEGSVRLTMSRLDGEGLACGDRLALQVGLRQPRNFSTPGSFDWVGHLARRQIRVVGSVRGAPLERALGPGHRSVGCRIARWRARTSAAIGEAVPGQRGAVLRALVVGDESAIERAVRDDFTRAGVVHVLSVSGLHVAIVASASVWLLGSVLGRSERVLLAIDVRRVAALGSLLPIGAYTLLAGAAVPTLRAATMAALAVMGLLLGRAANGLLTLLVAAAVLVAVSPGVTQEIGFQLSFASVFSLVVGGMRNRSEAIEGTHGVRAVVRSTLCATVAVCVGTAPLTAFHFHQVAPMGLVANPIVVPLFGSAVLGPALIGAVCLDVWPAAAVAAFRLAGAVVAPGLWIVGAAARPWWAAVEVPAPAIWEVVVLYAVVGGFFARRRPLGRAALVGGTLVLALDTSWWVRDRLDESRLRVTFLDVGQGDAAVVELPGGRGLMIDAGGFPGSDFDVGEAVVAPFLATRKRWRIDAVVMSHAHPDHFGGMSHLVRRYGPGLIWWPGIPGRGSTWEAFQAVALAEGVPLIGLSPGQLQAPWEMLRVLHPVPGATAGSLNDGSLVVRVAGGGGSVLFTGDIERSGEGLLLARDPALRSTVVKVPHHGSRTSSTPALVAATAPRIAVISVGAGNRYGLPAPEVEARWRAAGACVLRTDHCGTVRVTIHQGRPEVETSRPGCSCPPEALRPLP